MNVYLVTGSDRAKTIEQVGLDIYNRSTESIQLALVQMCMRENHNVYKSDWKPSRKLINFLSDELDYSAFPHKTGNHIEHRPGGINFSILGRGEDSMKHRKEYVKWDINTTERILMSDRIKKLSFLI